MSDQPAKDLRDDSAEDDRETDREIAEAAGRFLGRQAQADTRAVELSLGCGAAVPDTSAEAVKRRAHSAFVPLMKGGREVVRGRARVKPLSLSFSDLVDLLRSHIRTRYKHKVGPFIVGGIFEGSDTHPSGHYIGALDSLL